MSTDSTDSDVTPAHQPVIVEHLSLSWQRDATAVPVGASYCCVNDSTRSVSPVDSCTSVVRKGEQNSDDDMLGSTVSQSVQQESTDLAQSRRHSSPTHDDDVQPLDLTQRRRCPTDAESCDAKVSSGGPDGGPSTTSYLATQVLVLKGQRYEILPLGGGRWMSRGEYEVMMGAKLQNHEQLGPSSLNEDTLGLSLDRLHSDSTSDKQVDDVNGNTCDVTTGAPAM